MRRPTPQVFRDDVLLEAAALGSAQPANPGDHAVVVKVSGHDDAKYAVKLVEGDNQTLAIAAGPAIPPPAPPPAATAATPTTAGPPRGTGFSQLGVWTTHGRHHSRRGRNRRHWRRQRAVVRWL